MCQNCAVRFVLVVGAACMVGGGQTIAAENATNFYILGLKTQMAGYTPPPPACTSPASIISTRAARAVMLPKALPSAV